MKNILITAFFIMMASSLFSQNNFKYGVGVGAEMSYPSTYEETPLDKSFFPNQTGRLFKFVTNVSLFYYLEEDKKEDIPIRFFVGVHFANSTTNSVLKTPVSQKEQLSAFWISSAHFGYYKDRAIKNERSLRNQLSLGIEYANRYRTEGDFPEDYFTKNLLGLGFEWSSTLFRTDKRLPIGWGIRNGFSLVNLNGFKKVKEQEGYVYSNLFFRVLL